MKSMQRTTLMLALAGTLSMPMLSMAADAAKDEHSGHHPEQAQAAATPAAAPERMKAMRERMMAIRTEKDPAKRKQLLEAQMKDMEAMMEDGSCPMLAAGKSGSGMMGPGMGMGMMGPGMQGGAAGQDDMMGKRMEMMEKRMDMMQMMMQRGMGSGIQGGMGMPGK